MSSTEGRPAKRRVERWTKQQARTILALWRASGKTAAAFAAEQGVSVTRLSYWSRRIDASARNGTGSDPKVERRSSGGRQIEITLDQLTLRVSDQVDVVYIAQLVAALLGRQIGDCS